MLTIMCLSVDRYMAITQPVRSRRICTGAHVIVIIFICWAVNAIIMIPLATSQRLHEVKLTEDIQPIYFCHEEWPDAISKLVFDLFLLILIFLAPSSVVAYSYFSTGCSLLRRDESLRDQAATSASQKRIMAGWFDDLFFITLRCTLPCLVLSTLYLIFSCKQK